MLSHTPNFLYIGAVACNSIQWCSVNNPPVKLVPFSRDIHLITKQRFPTDNMPNRLITGVHCSEWVFVCAMKRTFPKDPFPRTIRKLKSVARMRSRPRILCGTKGSCRCWLGLWFSACFCNHTTKKCTLSSLDTLVLFSIISQKITVYSQRTYFQSQSMYILDYPKV